MSLSGILKVKEKLIGNIHLLNKVHGYSAYDLAVKYGYKGTEEEWLKSLIGPKGDPGTLENHSEINALGHRVVNVATPEEDTDGVNKEYVDNKCKKLISSEVEDISEDFISSIGSGFYEDINLVEVYKQGNVINGLVIIAADANSTQNGETFSEGKTLFTIDSRYRPKANTLIPSVTVLGGEGEETDCGIVIRYFAKTGTFVVVTNTREFTTHATLSFTYICN